VSSLNSLNGLSKEAISRDAASRMEVSKLNNADTYILIYSFSLIFLYKQIEIVLIVSSMKNNKSAASLHFNQSLNIRQIASPTHKKVEGFDNTVLSSTFTSKIDKLKNKPKTEAL
jgi:hypothetical protein